MLQIQDSKYYDSGKAFGKKYKATVGLVNSNGIFINGYDLYIRVWKPTGEVLSGSTLNAILLQRAAHILFFKMPVMIGIRDVFLKSVMRGKQKEHAFCWVGECESLPVLKFDGEFFGCESGNRIRRPEQTESKPKPEQEPELPIKVRLIDTQSWDELLGKKE
jgi:hypothetical protein